MHKNHIYYLSNMRQVLLLSGILKKNIQNIHWSCLNVQLNYVLWIYFLFLHVKIKTVQKISQFSCFHYTSACFYAVVKPIRQISYHFQKRCLVKAIRHENRAELSALNGNKMPIRYEFHNGVKPIQYNGNMVYIFTLVSNKLNFQAK